MGAGDWNPWRLAQRGRNLAQAAAYLPLAREAYKTLGPMISPAVQSTRDRLSAERHARRQAAGLIDGSWLPVYVGTRLHYVVWSGDEPVNAFPALEGDLVELTRHVDLARRRRPGEKRARRRGRRQA